MQMSVPDAQDSEERVGNAQTEDAADLDRSTLGEDRWVELGLDEVDDILKIGGTGVGGGRETLDISSREGGQRGVSLSGGTLDRRTDFWGLLETREPSLLNLG